MKLHQKKAPVLVQAVQEIQTQARVSKINLASNQAASQQNLIWVLVTMSVGESTLSMFPKVLKKNLKTLWWFVRINTTMKSKTSMTGRQQTVRTFQRTAMKATFKISMLSLTQLISTITCSKLRVLSWKTWGWGSLIHQMTVSGQAGRTGLTWTTLTSVTTD